MLISRERSLLKEAISFFPLLSTVASHMEVLMLVLAALQSQSQFQMEVSAKQSQQGPIICKKQR